MRIPPASPFLQGQFGLQNSQDKLTQASQNIAHSQQESPNNIPLEDSLVSLKSAELEAKASTRVIETANSTLGSLIDIKA
ncbi:hypothetical protein [Marinomonas epiphytica]